MRCGQCGEPVIEGAHFCGECGARLDTPQRPSSGPAPEEPRVEAPPPAEPGPESPPDATANTVHDVAVRNPKTAPMLQMPEFEAPADASSGVRPTLPMVEGRASPRVELAARAPVARRLAWVTLGLVACAGLALLFIGVSGGRFSLGRSEPPPEEPPTSLLPSPEGQGGTEPVTPTPPEEPEPVASAPPEPQRPPARGGASPKPPSPTPPAKPTPTPALPSPPPPSPTAPLPSPTTPPSPAPPAPSVPAPPLPLPQLPWTLPTAGACERCVQALRGSGHYTVVTAAGEALLCENGAARANCEREIGEVAPDVAERAAREGNCPAALATVAAAVNLRVAPDRFAAVNALCLR